MLASEVDSWIDNLRCPTLVGQVLHREGLDLGDFNGNVDIFNSILKTILEARQDGSKLWEHPGLQRRRLLHDGVHPNEQGMYIDSTCLLWVDDAAIITNNIEDQQTLLSITNNTANKYRIQFGQEKSKLLIIGKDNINPTIKLGDMTINPSKTYKYLGETLNTKNINDHIKEIERKTEAALQSALYIAGDDNYQGIEMETIWILIESCIIPIITYGSETWDINQNQTKRLNCILDNIIKRILNLPQSMARECLYYELGTLDIEHRIIIKRINYATTLLIKNPDNLRDILQTTNPKSWIQKTIQQARSVGLDLYTLGHISAKDRKILLKEPITKSMNGKHNTEGQNKSKFKFLTTNSETRRSE